MIVFLLRFGLFILYLIVINNKYNNYYLVLREDDI